MLRGLAIAASVTILAVAWFEGCSGDMAPFDPYVNNPTQVNDPGAACTDPAKCCKPEELVCKGDIDRGTVCRCSNLWDCNQNQTKCSKPFQSPFGSGESGCKYESEYRGVVCRKSGNPGDEVGPNGIGGWNCRYSSETKEVICQEDYPSNPTNKPPTGDVDWKCTLVISDGLAKIVCEREPPNTNNNTTGSGGWECNAEMTVCTKKGTSPTSSGGGSWNCRIHNGVVICEGDKPSDGSGGWVCEKREVGGDTKYVCKRPATPEDSNPPNGGGTTTCIINEFGTRCEKGSTPSEPPPIAPTPGLKCTPGEEFWCDGYQFCGWGTITCKPDGTFPTRVYNGKTILDCKERADAKIPNTLCAQLHYFFNSRCCERPDCKVVDAVERKPSAGEPCDPCNPLQPNCKQGICVVTNLYETFCSQHPDASGKCPSGMILVQATQNGRKVPTCIEADQSCYQ
ncbi:MAG: hypothetical protein H6707_07745 [Deltaproteobacteria bacterium]|nr:hypothetical protein [Deltaproteobacteria bacterium]